MEVNQNGGPALRQPWPAGGSLVVGSGQQVRTNTMANVSENRLMAGTLYRYHHFPSQYVPSRTIDVWLPPGYRQSSIPGAPVLYMHDGQNLFDATNSFGGVSWGVDQALTRLIDAGQVPPTIVVAIWNREELRYREYMPERPLASAEGKARLQELGEPYESGPRSNNYLRFIVGELKPFIDSNYNTRSGPRHTTIMGSSMGGLISLYALCEYPEIFGRAGCLSTHWTAPAELMLRYLQYQLPPPGRHRLYFDLGTSELDRGYSPWQAKVDELARAAGYRRDVDWLTRLFKGAGHHERDWRARLDVPLRFLLGQPGAG